MCLYFGTLDVHDWLVLKHTHKIVSNLLAYSWFEQSNTVKFQLRNYLCAVVKFEQA